METRKNKIFNKHTQWWFDKNGNTNKKWAIQDKSGIWWIVGGSEFPEKKLTNTEPTNKNVKKKIIKKYDYSLILLVSILGVSIAMNLALMLKFIF